MIEIFENLNKEISDYFLSNSEPLLTIYDTKNVAVNEVTRIGFYELRKATKNRKQYTAIINGSNFVKIAAKMLSGFNKDIFFGDTLQAAEDWLVSQ